MFTGYDLSPFLTIPVIGAVLVAHLALLAASWKFNPLFLATGAFLVLATLSNGEYLPNVAVMKYARVYVTFLIVVLALVRHRTGPLRPASMVLIAFAVAYVLAAVWSDSPVVGLAFKSFFFWAALAGVFLAYEIRTRYELICGLRLLMIVAAVGGAIAMVMAAMDPGIHLRQSRLAFYGSVANTFGINVVMALLICLYLALNERSLVWRVLAGATVTLLGSLVAWTGSRSAFIAGVAGSLVLAFGARKRWGWIAILLLGMGSVPFYLLGSIGHGEIMSRVIDMTNNRKGPWRQAVRSIEESPWIGHGWVTCGGQKTFTENTHNVYLHILLEMGIIGLLVFAACALYVAHRAIIMYRTLRQDDYFFPLALLPLGLLAAIALEGMAGVATATASQSTTLFLGFAVGLIDRLPELQQEERWHGFAVAQAGMTPGQMWMGDLQTGIS